MVQVHPETRGADSVGESAEVARNRKIDRIFHIAFGLLMTATVVSFGLWAFGQVSQTSHYAILAVTVGLGLFMAFNIGGNDVANAFGTSVGAGTLTMRQALLIAAVFEISGAVIAGGEVTDTVRSGIVDLESAHLAPMDFAFVMMAAILGASLWLMIATKVGLPVSTTHSIVGGIVGAAVTLGLLTGAGGFEMVQWGAIGRIVVSWFLSPALGGFFAYLLYSAIKKTILVYNEEADAKLRELGSQKEDLKRRHKERYERLDELQKASYTSAIAHDAMTVSTDSFDSNDLQSEYYRDLHRIEEEAKQVDAYRALERWVPLVAAFGAVVISAMMLFKGLANLDLDVDMFDNILIMAMVGVAVWVVISVFARSLRKVDLNRATFILFSWLQVSTASAFAFSHGSNDIANAVGPFVAVVDVLRTGQISTEADVPPQILLACGVALVVGLWFVGRKVIMTVGHGLTSIHPASGFSAELAAAGVVMGASLLGLPVSSTHILIGAVLGIGLVNRAANWKTMKPIAMAWVITLPVSAIIASVGVVVIRMLFG